MGKTECVFCKIIDGSLPCSVIADSEHILVIKDINPKAPVHYLIMPKQHFSDVTSLGDRAIEFGGQLMNAVIQLAREYTNGAFNLITNNGVAAGQSVLHLHFHFLAGKNFYDDGGLKL